jgi:hypothetical protein
VFFLLKNKERKINIKNEYKIVDNYVVVYYTQNDGKTFEILFDLEDLELVQNLSYSIGITKCKHGTKPYAKIYKYLGMIEGKPKYKAFYLHRILLNFPDSFVDHINHNTLDNRKSNLRLCTNEQNTKHKHGKNKNNKSGYRNVSWSEYYNKWLVQLQIDGKNHCLGKFSNVHDAGAFAKEMRRIYYGEFEGE